MTDASARPIGTGRVLARGWPVFVAAVLASAALESVLVAPDLTPAASLPFLLLVLAAFLLDVVLIVVVSVAASAAARRIGLSTALGPRPGRRAAAIAGTALLALAVALLAALAHAVAAAVVLLATAMSLPQVVAGRGIRSWLSPLRRVPARAVAWVLLSGLGLLVAAGVDAEAGFVLGTPVGSVAARLTSGVIGVVILCSSAVLAERAPSRRGRPATGAASVRSES